MVRVMILEPGKYAEVRYICPKKFSDILGGEPEIHEVAKGIAIAVNEEGKIRGLPLNRALRDEDGNILDIYAGTMVIFGCVKGNELVSIRDEQIIPLLEEFGEPETPDDWDEYAFVFTKRELNDLIEEISEKSPEEVVKWLLTVLGQIERHKAASERRSQS